MNNIFDSQYTVVITLNATYQYMDSKILFYICSEFSNREMIRARDKALYFISIVKSTYEKFDNQQKDGKDQIDVCDLVAFRILSIDLLLKVGEEERQLILEPLNLIWEFEQFKNNGWALGAIMKLKSVESEAIVLATPVDFVK